MSGRIAIRLLFRLWALMAVVWMTACAGHSARTVEARSALDAGNPEKALELYNAELEVDSAKALPKDTSGDNALLLLDRAVILQQLQDFDLSARDLQTADKQVEMMDFSRSTADEIGKYLFSDDTGPYKSPPYEKLMINTINMINYLAKGDLNGGRIEARRFAVMQKYLKDNESDGAELMGAGSYLAGFIFEQSNEPQTAMRYYDEALQYGSFRTLEEAIVRLSVRASYRTPRITEILNKHQGAPAPTAPTATSAQPTSSTASGEDDGEILVIVSYGRVPAKIAKRVPIGLALTYASGALSPHDRAQANSLAAQGLVTWVNFPTLGKSRGKYGTAEFSLDGRRENLDGVPIEEHTRQAWKEQEGAVVASAITRMISRVVAGQAAKKAGGDGGVGLLLSLATQATLTAADTPDTRSWATLPGRIALSRVRVKPGKHQVELSARGEVLRKTVEIRPGGYAAISLTVLR